MQLKFFWDSEAIWQYNFPNFDLLGGAPGQKLLICHFLNDDAGTGIKGRLECLDKDLISIEKIANKELDYYETSSEHWFAEINSQDVLIGWLLGATDDDPGELIETWSFEDFYTIVKAWYGMMQRRNYDEELIVEL